MLILLHIDYYSQSCRVHTTYISRPTGTNTIKYIKNSDPKLKINNIKYIYQGTVQENWDIIFEQF